MHKSNHFLLSLILKKGVLGFIFLFSVSILSAQTQMNTSEASSLKTLVKKQAAITKTVTSDFVQYKHLDFLSNDIKSTGKLAFKTPDKIKWEYTTPFKYTALFKNKTLYINDNGNKNSIDLGSNKIFTQLNQLITASIKGDMFNNQEFDISYYKNGATSEVHFMPKDQKFSEFIKAFHITFSSKGEVQEVKMIEPSDDYTQIVFSNRTINESLPDAIFAQ